jgi:hypothetical protein
MIGISLNLADDFVGSNEELTRAWIAFPEFSGRCQITSCSRQLILQTGPKDGLDLLKRELLRPIL